MAIGIHVVECMCYWLQKCLQSYAYRIVRNFQNLLHLYLKKKILEEKVVEYDFGNYSCLKGFFEILITNPNKAEFPKSTFFTTAHAQLLRNHFIFQRYTLKLIFLDRIMVHIIMKWTWFIIKKLKFQNIFFV